MLWAGWIVVSRFGMTKSALSPFDVVLLRYGTAFFVLLPFIPQYFPQNKPWWQIIILSSAAAGIPYSLSGFYAFAQVGVAQSSVLMNGTIGFFSLVIMKLWLREKNSFLKTAGVALCLVGVVVLHVERSVFDIVHEFGLPHILLIWTAIIMAFYGIIFQKWGFTWQELLVLAAPIQFIFAGILWLVFRESSGIYTTSLNIIMFQALYQALGPSILGVISYALAVKYLGRVPTSAMMALVPGVATFLALTILGEVPNFYEIAGITIVIFGILLTIDFSNARKPKPAKI